MKPITVLKDTDDIVIRVKVAILYSTNYELFNPYKEKVYPYHELSRVGDKASDRVIPSVGLVINKVYFPLMTFPEFMNGAKRKAIFKEHLSFVGWELLSIKALEITNKHRARKTIIDKQIKDALK